MTQPTEYRNIGDNSEDGTNIALSAGKVGFTALRQLPDALIHLALIYLVKSLPVLTLGQLNAQHYSK